MKLLLCSDFHGIGINYLNRFFDGFSGKNCLFVGYACEDDETMFESGVKDKLIALGFNVIDMTTDYKFNDKIDMIYSRGGNATKVLHYLYKYNQFNKIKELVEKQNVLYVGQSAGALIAGSDTEWTLRTEPYEIELKKLYGKDALKGFGWVNKMIFVHSSRYRMLWDDEEVDGSHDYRVYNKEFYSEYLKDLKLYKKGTYITLGNNQVLYQNGNKQKVLTYDWSHIPVADLSRIKNI